MWKHFMGTKSHGEVLTVTITKGWGLFSLIYEVQFYNIWLKKNFTTRNLPLKYMPKTKSFYNKNFIPLQSFLQYHFLHLFLHPFLHYCHQRNCLLLGKTKNTRQTCIIHFPNPYVYNSLRWHACPTAGNNKLLSCINFKCWTLTALSYCYLST